MTILFVLAVLLYGPFIANILTARSSDAAGRGMSLGFAVIQGLVLWIVLASMFAVAILRGAMPSYATAAAIVFLPLSAIAAASAMGLYNDRYGDWLAVVPALLPLLLALYAFWARMVGWHGTLPPVPTTSILGGAIVVLTIVPLVLTTIEYMPNPEREAAQAAERRAWEEQEKKRVEEADAADAARFARLGPDSPLRDYLEDLPPGAIHHRQALAGGEAGQDADYRRHSIARGGQARRPVATLGARHRPVRCMRSLSRRASGRSSEDRKDEVRLHQCGHRPRAAAAQHRMADRRGLRPVGAVERRGEPGTQRLRFRAPGPVCRSADSAKQASLERFKA